MTIRTYVWKQSDLSRAWDQLTDFAKDVAQHINAPVTTAGIADRAITQAKVAPVHTLSVYQPAAQAIANATTTPVQFSMFDYATVGDSLVYDPQAFRVSVRRAGLYRITLRVGIQAAAAAAGRIAAIVQRNGVDVDEASAGAVLTSPIIVQCTGLHVLAQGDMITGCARQTTTAAQALLTTASQRSRMQIDYVGGL